MVINLTVLMETQEDTIIIPLSHFSGIWNSYQPMLPKILQNIFTNSFTIKIVGAEPSKNIDMAYL